MAPHPLDTCWFRRQSVSGPSRAPKAQHGSPLLPTLQPDTKGSLQHPWVPGERLCSGHQGQTPSTAGVQPATRTDPRHLVKTMVVQWG